MTYIRLTPLDRLLLYCPIKREPRGTSTALPSNPLMSRETMARAKPGQIGVKRRFQHGGNDSSLRDGVDRVGDARGCVFVRGTDPRRKLLIGVKQRRNTFLRRGRFIGRSFRPRHRVVDDHDRRVRIVLLAGEPVTARALSGPPCAIVAGNPAGDGAGDEELCNCRAGFATGARVAGCADGGVCAVKANQATAPW